MDLELEAESFHAHIKRLRKADYPLHPLDVDFLQQKIRMLYEMMLELDAFTENARPKVSSRPSPPKNPVQTVSKDSTINIPSKTEQVQEISREIKEPVKPTNYTEDTETPSLTEVESNPVAETKEVPPTIEKEEKKVEPVAKIQEVRKEPEVTKTTMDLFSDIPSETLSDKIAPLEEPSVADRIQKSQISDLRQAIGINEKFQFINELFNGDLGKYNSAIDELNSFSGLDGAKTYLFELHVENQWADDSPALVKLSELLDRKFS